MNVTNGLKRDLERSGAPLLGSWLMTAAAAPAEAMGHCGFDFLVLDMEHVPVDLALLTELLRAIGNTGAAPLVRLPWNDRVTIKRVLDAGAATIMLPFVETADEAADAVRWAKYPPDGQRGVAAVHRASRYGAAADYLHRANEETCVIVQLETPQAVSRLAEIAAVPGIDGIFVGPGDLAAAMGHIGQANHPEVQSAVCAAAEEAARVGVPAGIVGPNPETVSRYIDYGFTFVAVASDMALMTGAARSALSAIRGDRVPPSGSAAY